MALRTMATFAACTALALLAGGCASPPPPRGWELPGFTFATPTDTFDYMKEALVRGEADPSYAHHEYLCFSERLKRERGLTVEKYYWVRDDVRTHLQEKIGAFDALKADPPELPTPDRAILTVRAGGQKARVVLIRENGYEVHFRDRTLLVFGEFSDPTPNVRISAPDLTLRLAIATALRDAPGLTPADVYEVRYLSAWKFYDVENSDFSAEVERTIKAKEAQKVQQAPRTKAPTSD